MQSNFFFARKLRVCPEVVPLARRQEDFFGIHHFRGHRRDKKVSSEQEIPVVSVKLRCLRIFEKHGSHKRQACACRFLDSSIQIRHQLIAQLDVFTANRFVFRAVHPRFLVRGAFCGVVTVNRIQRSDLKPARQQISRRGASKAADVITNERVA